MKGNADENGRLQLFICFIPQGKIIIYTWTIISFNNNIKYMSQHISIKSSTCTLHPIYDDYISCQSQYCCNNPYLDPEQEIEMTRYPRYLIRTCTWRCWRFLLAFSFHFLSTRQRFDDSWKQCGGTHNTYIRIT